MENTKDILQGNLRKNIILYIFPLIISSLIQKLFSVADIAVLGNMASSLAVASVGATSSICHLLIDTFFGISSGSKIVLARCFGTRDNELIKRASDTTIITALGMGFILLIPGLALSPFLLRVTQCPADCYEQALLYLRIYVMGAPATMLYNFASGVLITSGDTKRPMLYGVFSGFINLVLNVVLCFVLEEKVLAVAVATVASQAVGAILVLLRIRKVKEIAFNPLCMAFDFQLFIKMVGYGMPLALATAIYPIANLQIQSAINSYDVSAISGNSAGIQLEGFIAAFSASFTSATVTFMGQAIGAKDYTKCKKSFFNNLWMAVLCGETVGIIMFLLCPLLVKLIVPDDPMAVEYAILRLKYVALFHGIASANNVLGAAIQSFGFPIFTTVNSVVWVLCFRFFWMSVIYPTVHTFENLMLCFIVSWTLTLIVNVIGVIVIGKRFYKKAE